MHVDAAESFVEVLHEICFGDNADDFSGVSVYHRVSSVVMGHEVFHGCGYGHAFE